LARTKNQNGAARSERAKTAVAIVSQRLAFGVWRFDVRPHVAVMRKLLHIAFGVLKHQKPFNPLFLSTPKTV
jgi:hypothetical protein